MFAKPAAYDCIMRYSSLTPKLVGDNVPAPRGIGLKVFGVKGEKIWGDDKQTQDFTMNNYSVLELRTPKDTNEIADSLERNWNDMPGFVKELKHRPDADVACKPATIPNQQMYAMPEYSQSAYRYGANVARAGFLWSGEAYVGRKSEWPVWTPPREMIARQPEAGKYAKGMPGGLENPLGARTLHLYRNGKYTLYTIYSTSDPTTIGSGITSGCTGLLTQDMLDLYSRTPIHTKVIVLPA